MGGFCGDSSQEEVRLQIFTAEFAEDAEKGGRLKGFAVFVLSAGPNGC